ncbi:MAG: response regulator [Bryobacteraceae bacterium]
MPVNLATTLQCEFAPPATSQITGFGAGRPIQVLLVEDDPEAAVLARIFLAEDTEQQFRVEWSASLRDAMTRLTEPGIDVVLLDLGMPELTGYRTFRALRISAGEQLPIVVLTSDERHESKDLTLESGASGYLLKHSSTPDGLRRALRDAFLRYRPGRASLTDN